MNLVSTHRTLSPTSLFKFVVKVGSISFRGLDILLPVPCYQILQVLHRRSYLSFLSHVRVRETLTRRIPYRVGLWVPVPSHAGLFHGYKCPRHTFLSFVGEICLCTGRNITRHSRCCWVCWTEGRSTDAPRRGSRGRPW